MALVELEEVVKLYGGHPALGPVTARIDGDMVGLVGPNGAGKSTLIRLALGLIEPTSGTVSVLGEPVGPETRRRVGYFPEGEAVFPGLSGVKGVAYAGRLSGMGGADAMRRAHQVLDYVELGEERYRPVSGYSSGMRQRLKLAQALVHDPDLLILDEPTEAVDPRSRAHLLRLMRELQDAGIRLMVSTHLLGDLEEVADHVVMLADGRIAAQGTVAELRRMETQAYMVRADATPGRLLAALREEGLSAEDMGSQVRVAADAHAILAAADTHNIIIEHLAPAEHGLEERLAAVVGGAA